MLELEEALGHLVTGLFLLGLDVGVFEYLHVCGFGLLFQEDIVNALEDHYLLE